MKIVFCGFGRAGKECLTQLLITEDCFKDNVLVYTHDHPENREFIEFLNNLRIPFTLQNINKDRKRVEDFKPDYLISAYYRIIVKNEILSIVGQRAVNLHPSLLPDYRGCCSSMWAILNGESETGITFHYMTDDIDGGNILLQERIKIASDDTAYSLYHKLVALFVRNFPAALHKLLAGNPGQPQSKDAMRRYYPRELPFKSPVDIRTVSFDQASRMVRAYYYPPYDPVEFLIDGQNVKIDAVSQLALYQKYFMALK